MLDKKLFREQEIRLRHKIEAVTKGTRSLRKEGEYTNE